MKSLFFGAATMSIGIWLEKAYSFVPANYFLFAGILFALCGLYLEIRDRYKAHRSFSFKILSILADRTYLNKIPYIYLAIFNKENTDKKIYYYIKDLLNRDITDKLCCLQEKSKGDIRYFDLPKSSHIEVTIDPFLSSSEKYKNKLLKLVLKEPSGKKKTKYFRFKDRELK